jgi:hypothetical protein
MKYVCYFCQQPISPSEIYIFPIFRYCHSEHGLFKPIQHLFSDNKLFMVKIEFILKNCAYAVYLHVNEAETEIWYRDTSQKDYLISHFDFLANFTPENVKEKVSTILAFL